MTAGSAIESADLDESATPPHGDATAEAAMEHDADEAAADTDFESGSGEPDPTAQ
jgi:hypothetical protein